VDIKLEFGGTERKVVPREEAERPFVHSFLVK